MTVNNADHLKHLLSVASASSEDSPGALEEYAHHLTPEKAVKLLQELLSAQEQLEYFIQHSDIPDRCNMTHTEPYDFGECEVHDETFPLGENCKWFNQHSVAEVLQDEVDSLRGRAVMAEHKLSILQERGEDYGSENSYSR